MAMHTSKTIHKGSPFFSSIRLCFISASALASLFLTGCSYSWDDYDPRLANGSGDSVAKCGGTSSLVSDFSGDGLTDLWKPDMWGGANMTESNGELVYDLSSDVNQSAAFIQSEYFYDFRNDFASVEVISTPGVGKATQAFFSVGIDDANYIEIVQKEDMIAFGYERTDKYTQIKSIPYDPVAHRF